MTALSALDILKHPQSGDESDIKEAIQCAISALEKQIPKKPIIHGVRDRDINTISNTCPICNKHIEIRENYCKHCGQALDRSEE